MKLVRNLQRKNLKLLPLLFIFISSTLFAGYWQDVFSDIEKNYSKTIVKYTKKYPYRVGKKRYYMHPALIKAIITQESQGNTKAVSHAGAKGLMQIMDRTAVLLGADPKRLFEPEYNIKFGTMFMAALLTEHKGDLVKAISGYNGGSHNTEKRSVGGAFQGRIYDNPETKNYVSSVLNFFEHYKKLEKRIEKKK